MIDLAYDVFKPVASILSHVLNIKGDTFFLKVAMSNICQEILQKMKLDIIFGPIFL